MSYKILQYQREVLEKGKVKPVNLIHGEEEYLIKAFIEKLKSIYGENFTIVWGDEINPEDLYELVSEGSMFSAITDRVVLILNFDELIKKVGRKKKSMNTLVDLFKKINTAKLFAVVNRKLTHQELAKEPFKSISTLGDIILADRLSTKKIKEIVKKKLEREAGGIEDDALELLVEMCQGNLMILKQESEKLIAYADGKRITVEDVKKVCFPWESYSLFDYTDSFLEGDVEKTLRVLKDVYMKGIPALQVQALLSSYAIKIYTAHRLLEKGVSLDKALEIVGVKHQFIKLKFKNYLEKISKEKAEKLIEALYKLDYAEKVYFADPETHLRKFTVNFLFS